MVHAKMGLNAEDMASSETNTVQCHFKAASRVIRFQGEKVTGGRSGCQWLRRWERGIIVYWVQRFSVES